MPRELEKDNANSLTLHGTSDTFAIPSDSYASSAQCRNCKRDAPEHGTTEEFTFCVHQASGVSQGSSMTDETFSRSCFVDDVISMVPPRSTFARDFATLMPCKWCCDWRWSSAPFSRLPRLRAFGVLRPLLVFLLRLAALKGPTRVFLACWLYLHMDHFPP